jgi:HEAT repeat protein
MAVGNQALVNMARRRATRIITTRYDEETMKNVDRLIELLGSDEDDVRFAAVTCLGIAGAGAKPATRALTELQEKESKNDTRVMIKWALKRLSV